MLPNEFGGSHLIDDSCSNFRQKYDIPKSRHDRSKFFSAVIRWSSNDSRLGLFHPSLNVDEALYVGRCMLGMNTTLAFHLVVELGNSCMRDKLYVLTSSARTVLHIDVNVVLGCNWKGRI